MTRIRQHAVALVVGCLFLAGCGGTSVSSDSGSNEAADATSASSCPDAVDWSDAATVQGEVAEITGPVISASYRPDVSGEPTFLNIGVDYPDQARLTVVIWGEDRGAFPDPPEEAFGGETVCVRGKVFDYKGAAEIEVSDDGQIEVTN